MKPGDFHVGLLEFFAVLLPGAIAMAILDNLWPGWIVIPSFGGLSLDARGWAWLLVYAYFTGHLIFLVGSYLDRLDGALRKRLKSHTNENAFQCAMRIRNSVLDQDEQNALNPFQWSRSVLISSCPEAAQDVHRLEAISKFFRSLLVVFALAAIAFFLEKHWSAGAIAIGLVAACFVRYYEMRVKTTTQAYIHVVTLHGLGKLATAIGPLK